MGILADWTTAGPYRSLSWLTIVFTAAVVITLVLTLIELKDALKTYKAVTVAEAGNDGMDVLVTSTLLRSLGRFGIQIALLVLSCSAIYIGISENLGARYWYRVIFICSILLTEALLCGSAVNDIMARHKLEMYLRRKESDHAHD